jgi:DNA (cytosine-5)-methyltransferase 1
MVPAVVGTLSDGAHMGGGLTDRTPIQAASFPPSVSMCLNAGGMGRIDAETETLIATTGGVFDVAHSLKADGFDASEDGTGRGTPIIFAVRRLTPAECVRLMGFPDDYFDVPGKPFADGPIYKMLGNSMAVNVMRWIGERIQSVKEIAA